MAVTWDELPGAVRNVVGERVGPVARAVPNTEGQNNDFAAVLHTGRGLVFCKAVRGRSRRMRWLRNEITTNPLAAGVAPAVMFHADVAGWLIVGFEHVPGRHASLAPKSPDLPLITTMADRVSRLAAPGVRPLRERWAETGWWDAVAAQDPAITAGLNVRELERWSARAAELVDGDRLVHTDLHGDQFLISGTEARVIDWGFPGAGAPWVDTAFLVLRLMAAGHTVAEAETWAATVPAWASAPGTAVTAFAVYVAGLWNRWAVDDPATEVVRRATVAHAYAVHRLDAYAPSELSPTH